MKYKILIIDDEEMLLTMLKKCLQAENFLVYSRVPLSILIVKYLTD